jgi:hypothetical protein
MIPSVSAGSISEEEITSRHIPPEFEFEFSYNGKIQCNKTEVYSLLYRITKQSIYGMIRSKWSVTLIEYYNTWAPYTRSRAASKNFLDFSKLHFSGSEVTCKIPSFFPGRHHEDLCPSSLTKQVTTILHATTSEHVEVEF